MDPQVWHKIAAISGITALGLGTYGVHVLKPTDPSYKELVHTAALVAAPITKHPNVRRRYEIWRLEKVSDEDLGIVSEFFVWVSICSDFGSKSWPAS